MGFIFDNSGAGSAISNFSPQFIGTTAAPYNVVAGVGLDIMSNINTSFLLTAYVQGAGGPVNITANPQITDGYAEGQRLQVIGMSDTNTVTFENGDGLVMNGPRTLRNGDTIEFQWDGALWREINANQ